VDGRADHHLPAPSEAGQAGQPGQPLALQGGVQVADEEHVDVAPGLGPRLLQEEAVAPTGRRGERVKIWLYVPASVLSSPGAPPITCTSENISKKFLLMLAGGGRAPTLPQLIKGCRDYFETVRHIFAHAYYEPDRPLHEQPWGGLRWASLPPVPARHRSGKVAIAGHTPQKTGEILDLGYLKCIDTFCHGGGWLTALEVGTGKVWQANLAGKMRCHGT
jgi:hypothetical protein